MPVRSPQPGELDPIERASRDELASKSLGSLFAEDPHRFGDLERGEDQRPAEAAGEARTIRALLRNAEHDGVFHR